MTAPEIAAIATEVVQYGVKCGDGEIDERPSRYEAQDDAATHDASWLREICGPHSVVVRRVITTQWEKA